MALMFIALFIGIPVVWHWFNFNQAEVCAGSAILMGVGSAVFVSLEQSWQVGVLVFFIAAFFEFAVAYVIALIYRAFASAARSEYIDHIKTSAIPERRSAIGAVGALAIPCAVFGAWVVHGLQTELWTLPPTKALLGFSAFLILGVLEARRITRDRSARKTERDPMR
jgi:hypothetical protein